MTKILLSSTVALSLLLSVGTAKETPTSGFNHKIPAEIMIIRLLY